MSQILIHIDTIYLAGKTRNAEDGIKQQTKTYFEKVENLLNEAGSDKTHILQTIIWLYNMDDFTKMNEVWNAWIPIGISPARACGETKLASPELKVEIIVIAAHK